MSQLAKKHTDLDVYRRAFDLACRIFTISQGFPKAETYSLTDQVRRSSRSVCANLAEGWRRRQYEADFVHKLGVSEAEAAETQVWLEFAFKSGYMAVELAKELHDEYDIVIGQLVTIRRNAASFCH